MKEAYRYKEQLISDGSYDINGEFVPSRYGPMVTLILLTFEVLSETPKGYWINTDGFYSKDFPEFKPFKKWVSKTSIKSYTKLSKKEALDSYIARKRKQIKILESGLSIAKLGIENATERLKEV